MAERLGVLEVAKTAQERFLEDLETLLLDLQIAHGDQDLLKQDRHLVVVAADIDVEARVMRRDTVSQSSNLGVIGVLRETVIDELLVHVCHDRCEWCDASDRATQADVNVCLGHPELVVLLEPSPCVLLVADQLGSGGGCLDLLLLHVKPLRNELVLTRKVKIGRAAASRSRHSALELLHQVFRDLLNLVLSAVPLLLQWPVIGDLLTDDIVTEVVWSELTQSAGDGLWIEFGDQVLPADELLSRKRLLHHTTQTACGPARRNILSELELDLIELGHFVHDPLLRGSILEQSNVMEERLDNLRVVLEAVLCKGYAARKVSSSRTERCGARAQIICPAFGFQVSQKTSRTFVADQVRNIATRLRHPKILLVRVGEVQIQLPLLHHRLDEHLNAQALLVIHRNAIPPQLWQILIRHLGEELLNPLLQLIKTLFAKDDQLHAVRRVVLFVEVDERIPNLYPLR